MHVDQAEEICLLLDLRDKAAEVFKNAKPGTDDYKSSLNAITELSKSIDIAEKRYFAENIEKEKLEAEKQKDKANIELAKRKFEAERAASDRQFEEELKRRKKEFWIGLGANTAFEVTKLAMVQGMNNLEYDGKLFLSTKQAVNYTKDALRIKPKLN